MAEYLSQEWLDEYRSLAQDQPTRPGATFTIQYRITGASNGDIDYYWVMEDGRLLEAGLGVTSEPEVTLTMTYNDSARIQRGELGPTTAFMQGKIKAQGNVKKMMAFMPVASSPEWKALQEKVRVMTEF